MAEADSEGLSEHQETLIEEDDGVGETSNSPSPSPTPQRKEVKHDQLFAETTPTDLPPLLPGELVTFTEKDITYLDPFLGPQTGVLHITDYKMYFKSTSPTDGSEEPYILNVPLGVISHVEKIGRSRNKKENAYGLEIFCKDMRTLRFAHKQETHGRRLMYERLQHVAFPISDGKNVFAFNFTEEFSDNGWLVYNAEAELKRLGVGKEDVPWRISTVNQDFKLCETYPQLIGVPLATSDEDLKAVASFRSKGRIPVLSWLHPVTHASITRCSQPLVGAATKRSTEDETYFDTIYKANNAKKLYIMDARPKINAVANLTVGGGWEYDTNYPNTEFSFLDIGNIHVMREGLRKLQDICYPDVDDQRWFSSLEATHWLDYIKDVLGGAVRVAEVIEKQKSSVLVHCSDGWDRTAQLTALAMLMLDPHYRTIRGFELLVEKEWISLGHKFSQRIGHGDKNSSDDQRAPIFVQFMDCVWQMTVQFPYAFEFNEHFLVTILDHLYSCLFGTFLCNCEKPRVDKGVREKTISLWSFINGQVDMYRNPLYSEQIHQTVLFPTVSIRKLQLWNGYYLRWNPRMRPQEAEFERCRQLQVLIKLLQDKCQELQKSTPPEATAVA
ncbi:myotubularin-related protein 2-like [Halichondria panicea]|uniref:myotubularin-related protein 2-like n=1 Tax=Halichondria panicea TaxID=6063 RepID=UPI00312B3B6D